MNHFFKSSLRISVLAIVLLIPLVSLAEIKYRLATQADVTEVAQIMKNYSLEDRTRLIYFPVDLQRDRYLSSAIEHGRLFVAIDDADHNRIVSYIKTYLIQDKQEVKEVLVDELRCLGPGVELKKSEQFHADRDFKEGQKLPLNKQCHLDWSEDKWDHQAFIYYGGAYTVESHRGKGISSKLLKYSLESISKNLEKLIVTRRIDQVAFLFGQVDENLGLPGSNSMIAVLSKYLNSFAKNTLHFDIQHGNRHGFQAYKPTFHEDGKVSFDTPGMGSILIFNLANPQ